MGKRKQSKAEDGEVQGVQREKVAAAGPKKKRRLAKRTNRGKVAAAAGQQTGTSEPLGVLNDDCLLHVLSFIDGPKQLLQQRALSRRWGSLASSDPLWRPLFLRTFGPHVYDAADEEQAWKGDRPVSRSFSYYAEADEEEEEEEEEEDVNAKDDEHPHWEYSDEETEEPMNEKKKKMKKMVKKTKVESRKGASGGCGPVDDSSLQASVERVRRALESKGSADGGTWFYRYIAACRLMPRPRLPHVTDALKRKVKDWCAGTEEMEDSCHYTGRLDFCMIDLPHYPRGDVHYRLHRLAVLLSLLSINNHAPKPGDEIQIGYAGKCRTITLARFCYAFLHGKERELAEELDLLTPPPIRPPGMEDKKSKAARKPPRRKCWREFKEPALSLNVVGDFTPFAFFLSGPYGQKTHSFDTTYPCLDDDDDDEELFGSSSDVQASYCFRTPKGGWAPGFFNASFSWCSHAAISTFYNPARRQILVIKALEKEMVW